MPTSAAARERGSNRADERGSAVAETDRGSLTTPPERGSPPPDSGSLSGSDFLESLDDLDDLVSIRVC